MGLGISCYLSGPGSCVGEGIGVVGPQLQAAGVGRSSHDGK